MHWFLVVICRPPLAYCETKIERPVLGILQPSVGIPFKPLDDFDDGEEPMFLDTEGVNKVPEDEAPTKK